MTDENDHDHEQESADRIEPWRCPIGIPPKNYDLCSVGTCWWCLSDHMKTHSNAEPQRMRLVLERCRTVLANMALENDGSFLMPRWPIHHEPLRNDAKNLLPLIDGALVQSDAEVVRAFAKAMLHGDDEHKAWLLEAAEAFIAGNPLPPPRGKGIGLDAVDVGLKLTAKAAAEGYPTARELHDKLTNAKTFHDYVKGQSDPLPRKHQDPSKWPTRETVERAHALAQSAEPPPKHPIGFDDKPMTDWYYDDDGVCRPSRTANRSGK